MSTAPDLCALVAAHDTNPRQVAAAFKVNASKSRDPSCLIGPRVGLIATNVSQGPQETVDPLSVINVVSGDPKKLAATDPLAALLASKAWLAMCREQADQLVNIQLLTCVTSASSTSSHVQLHHLVIEQIIRQSAAIENSNHRLHVNVIKAHILLDALTCVTTAQGKVSARCGKLSELQFDNKGALVGAKICDYHLDCGRVGQSNSGTDSNFHVLYALVHAVGSNPDLKRTKLVGDVTRYNIICQGSQIKSTNITDPNEFQLISKCMSAVGLKKRFQRYFFDVLAGLIHLGNVEFIADLKDKSAAAIRNMDVLETAANLLGVSSIRLTEVLTCKTVTVGDSSYTDFLTPVKAQDARSTFITDVYSSVVAYIIDLTNQRLNNETALAHTIAVVDMGGIESTSDSNAAHQLCRNYAVDRMHIYCLERLATHLEDCGASKESLALTKEMAAQHKNGPISLVQDVFDLLEKESRPKTAAENNTLSPTNNHAISTVPILDKLYSSFSQHPCYEEPPKGSASAFSIRHTFGLVSYSVAASLKQMSGSVSAEVISLCRTENNTNPVLLRAFSEQRIATYSNPKRSKTIVGGRAKVLRRAPTVKARSKSVRIKLSKQPMADANLDPGSSPVGSEPAEGQPDDENEMPLSRLSNNVYCQQRMAIDKLIQTLSDCNVWELILSPASALTEDLIKQIHIVPLITGFSEKPYSIVTPVDHFSKMYPGITKGIDSGPSFIDQIKERCPGAGGLVVLPDIQSVLLQDIDWFALEAAEYQLQPDGARLCSTKDFKSTFERIIEKSKRQEAEDDDKSIAVESVIAQDEAELGELAATKPAVPQSNKGKAPPTPKPKLTPTRRRWELCTTLLTWWIPELFLTRCGGMGRRDVRQSWREKVALCILIAMASAGMIFFITGFSRLMCPEINMYTLDEFRQEQTSGESKWLRFVIHGDIIDVTDWVHPNAPGFPPQQFLDLRGRDVSPLFPRWNPTTGDAPTSCTSTRTRRHPVVIPENDYLREPATIDVHRRSQSIALNMKPELCIPSSNGGSRNVTGFCHSYSQFSFRVAIKDLSSIHKVATVAWNVGSVGVWAREGKTIFVVDGKVYDATDLLGARSPLSTQQKELLKNNAGKDITSYGKQYLNMKCLDDIAYIGVIDTRDYVACNVSTYILYGMTALIVGTMAIKFLSALQLGSKRQPEEMKKYAIMQVPCYSEGIESLKKTINSLAVTDYDDTRKLLFVVADGLIKGSGNEKPTPDLVLDILGVSESHRTAQGFSYHAVSEGSKGHNKAKVYSGLYHISGRAIPYVVVIKCGTEVETTKAGNRGKRDSQMILMKWMNKVLLNLPMTPLELEMYRHVRNIIGVPPASYEYVLMVDADTEVGPDCLTRLVSACVNDAKVMGICGETKIANEKQSWVTMIQVYEYYISHHLSKAFESLFGSVTCLPGCFSMYRLYTLKNEKKTPVLVDSNIITAYSECVVDTLHKKNLLHLGEDRYLTTLMLKTFPDYKMKFAPDSHCLTIVPDKFSVLVSQRRRWVNSTIHNLFELTMISDMCGCLIFSMRFIVILDLFATLVMPASVIYLMYLLYCAFQDIESYKMVMYLVAVTYGMQAVIFLIKRKWEHVGWMIVHIIAMPVFYMYIPMYSYWHFDDFSWGATRRIEGDTGNSGHEADEDRFDPDSIPTARWDEYKKSKKTEESLNVAKSVRDGGAMSKSGSKSSLRNALSVESLKRGGDGGSATVSTANLVDKQPSKFQLAAYNGGHADPVAETIPRTNPMMGQFGVSPSMNNLFMMNSSSPTAARVGDPSAYISDAMLMNQVRVIISSQDLSLLTKKKVRTLLTSQFGVDLSSRRAVINECIDVALFEVNQQQQ